MQEIRNKEKYGEIVDRLILTDDGGVEFQCLVHGHDFKVGDDVIFTVVEGHVSAIIHSEWHNATSVDNGDLLVADAPWLGVNVDSAALGEPIGEWV